MNQTITQLAQSLGFDLVGTTSAELDEPAFSNYEGWVTQGRAAEMAYMKRDLERRRNVKSIMPDAESVICLGVNYYRPVRERSEAPSGQVARYAYGRDYHKIIEKMLKQLVAELDKKFPGYQWKTYADTGAVLERSYAEQAGLGYIGKNTMLITPEYGSWVFLCEVITDLKIPKDGDSTGEAGQKNTCGYCRSCLDICPTGALVDPNELDANKCISYLTIENRGSIPVELRPLIGDWLYGCDLCQEICPKNNRALATGNEEFTKKIGGDIQELEKILELRTKEEFDELFAGSPMRRAKREGLVRNACVVAANVEACELLPLLKDIAQNDSSEMVREHADWAAGWLKLDI